MPGTSAYYVDLALAAIKAECTDVNINSAEPTTWAAATSGGIYLGKKVFGAGLVFPGAIAAGTGSSRKITSAPVTDGAIGFNGTASHFSATNNSASRLGVAGALSATQAVTQPNPFTLGAFDFQMAYA